jgi:hypothetical protein
MISKNKEKKGVNKEWKNTSIWAFILAVILEICFFFIFKNSRTNNI